GDVGHESESDPQDQHGGHCRRSVGALYILEREQEILERTSALTTLKGIQAWEALVEELVEQVLASLGGPGDQDTTPPAADPKAGQKHAQPVLVLPWIGAVSNLHGSRETERGDSHPAVHQQRREHGADHGAELSRIPCKQSPPWALRT